MPLIAPQIVTVGGLTAFVAPVRWLAVLVTPTPVFAREAAAAYPKTVALLDGPMFEVCAGQPSSYVTYQCGRTQTALADGWTGSAQPGWMPEAGATLIRRGSLATVVSGLAPATSLAGADLVVQARPELIRAGIVVQSVTRDTEATRRAGFGLLAPDVFALVVSRPMGLRAFAEAGRELLGLEEFIYTDGGGSTELLVVGIPLGGTTGRSRRVPTFLAAIDPDVRDLGL